MLRIATGAVGVLVVVGGVGAGLVLQGSGGSKAVADPQPSVTSSSPSSVASPTASAAPVSASPSAPGNVSPTAGLALGPAATVGVQAGHSGPAMALAGKDTSYARALTATVDTASDFTVASVVRADGPTMSEAAVSQGSGAFYSFFLGRENAAGAAHNCWVFKVQTAAAAGKTVMALSKSQVASGRWTTLAGVFDAKAHTIALYVDGVQAATARVPGMIAAPTPMEIGRARYANQWADDWQGALADIQVWQQALSPAQIAAQAQADAAGTAAPVPATAGWLTATA